VIIHIIIAQTISPVSQIKYRLGRILLGASTFASVIMSSDRAVSRIRQPSKKREENEQAVEATTGAGRSGASTIFPLIPSPAAASTHTTSSAAVTTQPRITKAQAKKVEQQQKVAASNERFQESQIERQRQNEILQQQHVQRQDAVREGPIFRASRADTHCPLHRKSAAGRKPQRSVHLLL
jgi:flagellar biosynthesis GTPase FlhF